MRKIPHLKSYTRLALEPLQSHGLTPQTVTAVTDQGCSVSLELSEGPSQTTVPATSSTAEPEENTRSVLFLLDRFGVSDEFYHELTQVHTVKGMLQRLVNWYCCVSKHEKGGGALCEQEIVMLYIANTIPCSNDRHAMLMALALFKSCIIQVVKDLPRLHHVKQLRKELNTHVKPIRLDPPYMGCYRHVRELVSATLETTVNREKLV